MFAKTTAAVVAALLFTGVSAPTYAAPIKAPTQAEQAWMNRASNPDTNGF